MSLNASEINLILDELNIAGSYIQKIIHMFQEKFFFLLQNAFF